MGAGGEGPSSWSITKPQTDKLGYGFVRLENGLQALLISDPETDKAAVAMDVRVGSMSDPEELPGLAHFCEHMLFYSSEKFPEEDAYSKFISEHGGSTNAYTAAESTNYHFDINHDHLEPSLDRFACFFLCPLISQDGVEREVKAVDSEHGKNVNADNWRFAQLWRHVSNQAHPFSRFHTGNLETLLTAPKAKGVQVHEAVREFAASKYSSNLMRLVVYGRQNPLELELLVRAKFGGVKDLGLAPREFSGDAVGPEHLKSLIRVVPQKEGDLLSLQWPIPPEQPLYRTTPSSYLSHLLGHEGKGSIFALLKAKGWATGLSAGESGSSYSTRSFFSVTIVLTREGNKNVEGVVALVFAYLDMLRQPGGITEDRYEEMRALAHMRFNFSDKINPGQLTTALAQQLQTVQPQDCLLSLHNVPLEYDPRAIAAVLAQLTPDTLRIMWASRDFEGQTTEQEPWYGTHFSREPIPQDWTAAWSGAKADGLHLPEANPFIATDFDLIQVSDSEAHEPRIVLETPLLTLWHKPCVTFSSPKAIIYLAFNCPEAYSSPESAVLTRLFTKLLSDYLNELAYPAELAGLDYGVHNTTSGFRLSFSGYSHKLGELVKHVLQKLADFKVFDDRFAVVEEALAKEYANQKYEQPYQRAIYTSSVLLEYKRWHIDEYCAVIQDLQPSDLTGFFRRLVGRSWLQAFATGNMSQDTALRLAADVEAVMKEELGSKPIFPSQRSEGRVLKLAPGRPALLSQPGPNPANENSAIILTYQVGPDEVRSNMLLELFVNCSKRDAFHSLRTQQQLGYIVFLTAWSSLTVRSVAFILQSTEFGAEVLEQRCEEFVQGCLDSLEAMPDDEFQQHVEELAKAKLEKPKRLREQAGKEWREIDEGTQLFDRPQAEVAALRALTKPDLIAFFKEAIWDPHARRKVSVHIEGSAQAADSADDAPASNGVSATGDSTGTASAPIEAATHGLENGAPDAVTSNGDFTGALAGGKAARGPEVELITDLWAFKRSQEAYASPE